MRNRSHRFKNRRPLLVCIAILLLGLLGVFVTAAKTLRDQKVALMAENGARPAILADHGQTPVPGDKNEKASGLPAGISASDLAFSVAQPGPRALVSDTLPPAGLSTTIPVADEPLPAAVAHAKPGNPGLVGAGSMTAGSSSSARRSAGQADGPDMVPSTAISLEDAIAVNAPANGGPSGLVTSSDPAFGGGIGSTADFVIPGQPNVGTLGDPSNGGLPNLPGVPNVPSMTRGNPSLGGDKNVVPSPDLPRTGAPVHRRFDVLIDGPNDIPPGQDEPVNIPEPGTTALMLMGAAYVARKVRSSKA